MTARTRLLITVPLVLVIVAGGLFAFFRMSRPSTAFALVDETTLVVLRGSAEILRSDGTRQRVTPSADARVRVGDRVQTAAETDASITYFDGSSTELAPDTSLIVRRLDKLPGGGVGISFYQEAGQTWNRVERLVDANSRFETVTATSVAYVRGTEYLVRIEPGGQATIQAVTDNIFVEAAGVTIEVPVGFQTVVTQDQAPAALQPIPPSPAGLRIQVTGPVRPFVTDDRNRSVGFQPEAAAYGSQIPGATYSVGAGGQTLTIPDPALKYTVTMSADGAGGAYTLTVTALAGGEPVAARSSGLARALGAEQLSGTLTTGQNLGTGFEFRNGQIANFVRPGSLVGGAPPGSRMLFVPNQQGTASQILAAAVNQATQAPRTTSLNVTAVTPIVTAVPAAATSTQLPATQAATATSLLTATTGTVTITATGTQFVGSTSTSTVTLTRTSTIAPTSTLVPTVPPPPTVAQQGAFIPPTAAATVPPIPTDSPTTAPTATLIVELPTAVAAITSTVLPPMATTQVPISSPTRPSTSTIGTPGTPMSGTATTQSTPINPDRTNVQGQSGTHFGGGGGGAAAAAALTASPTGVTVVPPTTPGPAPSFSRTLQGNYTAEGVGLRGRTAGTINLSGIPDGAAVRQALLYWAMLDNGESASLKNVTLNGTPITGTRIGSGPDTCWQRSTSVSYRADVTPLVSANGPYNLTNVAQGGAILADGASLVVIYELATDPLRTIMINDGNTVLRPDQTTSASSTFTGFNAASPDGKTTFIVGDGQTGPGFGKQVVIAGTLGSRTFSDVLQGADGSFWDNRTFTSDVGAVIGAGSSTFTATVRSVSTDSTTTSDCVVWVAQVLWVNSSGESGNPTPTSVVTATPTVPGTLAPVPTPTISLTPTLGPTPTNTVAPTATPLLFTPTPTPLPPTPIPTATVTQTPPIPTPTQPGTGPTATPTATTLLLGDSSRSAAPATPRATLAPTIGLWSEPTAAKIRRLTGNGQ